MSTASDPDHAEKMPGLAAGVERVTQGPADFIIWRPQSGYFYSRNLAGTTTARQWGASTDIPVVGDFDGDGKKDFAVWRPATGDWYIIQSSNGQVVTHQWGASTDVPIVGDFDGDGKSDIAVWRPATGDWYIIQSSNGQSVTHQWGESTDLPVIGDFDGDGKTDIAVWRPSTGYWYIVQSSNGAVVAKQWGASTDVPVAGDFDGDGKTDIAVWRPSTGYWYIVQSSNGGVVAKQWGQVGDIPVPQDYDGDGKTDIAVWRPSTGYWYVIESGNGEVAATQWGASTDRPANGSLEPRALSTVGGIVIGLTSGVTVSVRNGADTVPVSANGSFTFPTALASGDTYSVTVGTPQPTGQTCAVQNASGTVGATGITNVVVYCTFDASAATLTGTYEFAGYNISSVTDALYTVDFDGVGSFSGTYISNVNETLGSGTLGAQPYTVAANGAQIPVLTTSGNNIGAVIGSHGDVFVWLANTSSGQQPAMAVGVKPQLNPKLSSIAGTWVGPSLTPSSNSVYGSLGTATIGVDGSLAGTETNLSAAGVVSTEAINAGPGNFAVGNGGEITSGGTGGGSGYISADGDLLFLTYVTGTNNLPGLTALVKQGTGLTAAALNGIYTVVALGATADNASDGQVLTLYAHGNGTYTVTGTSNAAGKITTSGDTGTYTVAGNGTLTVVGSGGDSHSGQLSADGNVLVLGNISSGEEPKMYIGVRQ